MLLSAVVVLVLLLCLCVCDASGSKLMSNRVHKAYNVLNLKHDATLEEAKDSRRTLALKYHPDKCNSEIIDCNEKMASVNDAFAVVEAHLSGSYESDLSKEANAIIAMVKSMWENIPLSNRTMLQDMAHEYFSNSDVAGSDIGLIIITTMESKQQSILKDISSGFVGILILFLMAFGALLICDFMGLLCCVYIVYRIIYFACSLIYSLFAKIWKAVVGENKPKQE